MPSLLTSTPKQKRTAVGVPHRTAKANKLTLSGAIPSGGKCEGMGDIFTWQGGSMISQRDCNSRFSQRLSADERVSFSPSRHWRSSSMLSGPMRANTWGDSQST